MIVLTGESGSGKSTVERKLVDKGYKRAISHTTRPIRAGERNGMDYYFVSKDEIVRMKSEGRFAEYIPYLDNIYALSIEECEDDRIVVVEPTGLLQLQEKDFLDIFVVYLYTSENVREQRMLGRGDDPEKVRERIERDREVFSGIGEKANAIINAETNTIEQIANIVIERYFDYEAHKSTKQDFTGWNKVKSFTP